MITQCVLKVSLVPQRDYYLIKRGGLGDKLSFWLPGTCMSTCEPPVEPSYLYKDIQECTTCHTELSLSCTSTHSIFNGRLV